MKRKLAILLVWLASSVLTSAHQDETPLTRLDALLDTLEPPTIEELLEPIGPVPALDEVLQPLAPDFVPLLQRKLDEETGAKVRELGEQRSVQAERDLEQALIAAEEIVEVLTEKFGRGNPKTCAAVWAVRDLEARARVGEIPWRQLRVLRDRSTALLRRTSGSLEPEAQLLLFIELAEIERGLLGEDASLSSPLGNMASPLFALGEYKRAERVARAGLERTFVEQGFKHPFVTRSLNDLALLATAYRRFDDAEALHGHSLALRRELYGDQGPEYALALMHLVELYRLRNELGSANEVAERAIAILTQLGTMPERLGVLLLQRGVLEWSAGDDEQARQSLEESIGVLQSVYPGDHQELAKALGALADVERGQGNFQRALELAESALAMNERLHAQVHPLKSQAQHRLALCLEVLGELDRAEQTLRTAIDSMRTSGVASSGDLASALDGLASLLTRKGESRAARTIGEDALAEQRKVLGTSRLLGNALSRAARRRAAGGDLDAAALALREALELFVELMGPENVRVSRARVELAEILAAKGDPDEALVLVYQVLEAAPSAAGASRLVFASASQLAGHLALARGELEVAFEHARRARERREALLVAPHSSLLETLALEGRIHEASRRHDAAAVSYAAALEQANALRTRIVGDERTRALYADRLDLGSLSRSLGRMQLELGRPEAALEAAELGRERALLDLLERSGTDLVATARAREETSADDLALRIENKDKAHSALLLAEQRLRRQTSSPGTDEARVVELEVAAREARRVWALNESALVSSLRAVWPSAQPVPSKRIADSLRPNEALLHYSFDPRGVSLVVVRGGERGAWQGHRLTADSQATRSLAALLLAIIERVRTGEAVDAEQRQALSEALLPSAAWEALQGCERVVVVPDGPLHELPFEVLNTPRGEWLEHGPRLVYSPSAALFARNRGDAGETHARERHAVVLGAPSFAATARGDEGSYDRGASNTEPSSLDNFRLFGARLAPLPGSALEARRVGRELDAAGWQVELLLAEEARAPLLRRAAAQASLVHLATHGLAANAERPYEAALALATPREFSADDDGFLTLDDLVRGWGGVLQGCDLVVLSACDTQVGVALGNSRVALSWGFFFAGADSVLVSLWKVDDRATVLLMDRFYSNYTGSFDEQRSVAGTHYEAGQPLPEDAALQEAKAWLANSDGSHNRARLAELGFDAQAAGTRGDFPLPGSAPSTTPTAQAFDFRAPKYGSAFALYGQPD